MSAAIEQGEGLFAPNVTYPMLGFEKPCSGFQVGVLAIRLRDDDEEHTSRFGARIATCNYVIDHMPSGLSIEMVDDFGAALFIADELSITAPETRRSFDEMCAWIDPRVKWLQVARMDARANREPLTYRAWREANGL